MDYSVHVTYNQVTKFYWNNDWQYWWNFADCHWLIKFFFIQFLCKKLPRIYEDLEPGWWSSIGLYGETDNPHDSYAVSIIRNSYVEGHVPLGLSKTFSNLFSLPVSTMLCIVTGKRLNCGAGLGLEILVMYQARGHEKALQWLEKTITKIVLHADDLGSKFKSK